MFDDRLWRWPALRMPGGLRVVEARSPLARILGLALLDELSVDEALLITRCRSVHTLGMRFRIDVVFLDGDQRVLRVIDGVPPRRLLACRRAAAVLETRAGEAPRFVDALRAAAQPLRGPADAQDGS